MIKYLLEHALWLLLYGLIWAFIFSYKMPDDQTLFSYGHDYVTNKRWKAKVGDFIEENTQTKEIEVTE